MGYTRNEILYKYYIKSTSKIAFSLHSHLNFLLGMCLKDHPVFFSDAMIHPTNILIIQFGPDSSRHQKHTAIRVFSAPPRVVHHSTSFPSSAQCTTWAAGTDPGASDGRAHWSVLTCCVYETPQPFLYDWGHGSNFMLGVVLQPYVFRFLICHHDVVSLRGCFCRLL